jgi:ornithine decarboxylase
MSWLFTLVARKSRRASERWLFFDAGPYNGMPETQGDRIFSINARYELPLAVGDPIDVLSAGAYTASYASMEFNGFSPLPSYCI